MTEFRPRIEAEIIKALQALGAPPAALRLAGADREPEALSAALARLGAPIELLAIIGSLGDTLSDEQVLAMLEDFNRAGRAIEPDLEVRGKVAPMPARGRTNA